MSNPIQQAINQLSQAISAAHAKIKSQDEYIKQIQSEMKNAINSKTKSQGMNDQQSFLRYVEEIPGRRIPFDLTVNINIGANITDEQSGSVNINQDGPFIAVARMIAFQSTYKFQYTDPQTSQTSTFNGRSFGRYRPTNSAIDLNDGSPGFQPVVGAAFPGSGEPIYASPSNHSSFRSMSFDAAISFTNDGSGYGRQQTAIPSSFYQQNFNEPFVLGALDFFERGEVLNWKVMPLHVNNPPAGNIQNFGGTNGLFPFLDSQYDVHEGIADASDQNLAADPIIRLPNGVLTIGFHGYKILQPPGTVSRAFV